MKNLQNITFTVKLKSPLKMSTIMYFSEYVICCFSLQLIWFLKRFFFFCVTRSRACETRSESREVTVRV